MNYSYYCMQNANASSVIDYQKCHSHMLYVIVVGTILLHTTVLKPKHSRVSALVYHAITHFENLISRRNKETADNSTYLTNIECSVSNVYIIYDQHTTVNAILFSSNNILPKHTHFDSSTHDENRHRSTDLLLLLFFFFLPLRVVLHYDRKRLRSYPHHNHY